MTDSPHARKLADRVARTADRIIAAADHGVPLRALADHNLGWYAIRNAAGDEPELEPDVAEVLVYEEIGGSFGVNAERFAQDLQEITAPTIHLRINSPGGSVFDALAMHSSLLHHPARVVTFVDGVAASAASVVAMAGDEIVMMPGSQFMVHDASATFEGNAGEAAKLSTFLDRQSDNIASMYAQRRGGTAAEWRELMLAETWTFADESVELGLADRVLEQRRADPEPEVDDKLTRAHDLSRFGYRYAGRHEAPTPGKLRRTAHVRPVQKRQESAAQLRRRASSDQDRRDAALQRREAAAGRGPGGRVMSRRMAPVGLSAARQASFPATLRGELTERDGQRYHLVGRASVAEQPYEMWDEFGPYMEVVDKAATPKALRSKPDTAYLVNHRGITMARTVAASGNKPTLELRADDEGSLAYDAWLNPKRNDVHDLMVAVDDGDITENSFAFLLVDGVWSEDFSEFRILEYDLNRGDVSAVNYGANPYTDIAARAGQVLADLDRLPESAKRTALSRLQDHRDVDALFAAVDAERDAEITTVADERPAAVSRRTRSLIEVEAMLLD